MIAIRSPRRVRRTIFAAPVVLVIACAPAPSEKLVDPRPKRRPIVHSNPPIRTPEVDEHVDVMPREKTRQELEDDCRFGRAICNPPRPADPTKGPWPPSPPPVAADLVEPRMIQTEIGRTRVRFPNTDGRSDLAWTATFLDDGIPMTNGDCKIVAAWLYHVECLTTLRPEEITHRVIRHAPPVSTSTPPHQKSVVTAKVLEVKPDGKTFVLDRGRIDPTFYGIVPGEPPLLCLIVDVGDTTTCTTLRPPPSNVATIDLIP